MKIDKPRFRYLAALILFIPALCTLIFFLAGLVGAVALRAFGIVSYGQAVFICLGLAVGGLIAGIVTTAQKIQQALRAFRTCDQIEDKKV